MIKNKLLKRMEWVFSTLRQSEIRSQTFRRPQTFRSVASGYAASKELGVNLQFLQKALEAFQLHRISSAEMSVC